MGTIKEGKAYDGGESVRPDELREITCFNLRNVGIWGI